MDTTNREHIILRHLANALTVEEERELMVWREASPDNEAFYVAHQKLWQATVPVNAALDVDLDTEWHRLRQRLQLDTPSKGRLLQLHPVWRYTAVAAVLLILGTFVLFLYQQPQPITVATANAETRAVTLADGSVVRLNSGSRLTFPPTFAEGERRVQLEGEALFDVVASEAPFVVASANAEVHVLGTVFSVWARGTQTRVAVQEGRVALEAPDGTSPRVEVTANQAATRQGDQPPERLDTGHAEAALAWLSGRIVFERTPLAEVLAELTRIYDRPIELRAPSLAAETITGSFTDKPLDVVLNTVCLSVECQVVPAGRGFVIAE